MKKSVGLGLGISALTMAVSLTPMNVNASESISCQQGNAQNIVIWNGNCDISSIPQQLQDCLNKILGNVGDSETDDGYENDGDSNEDKEENENSSDNSYIQQVVDLVNVERAKEGLSALNLDETVTEAANVRAIEIQSSFSHTRPDGSNFNTVLTQQGVTYRSAGENIAYGQRTPEEVVTGWMNSAGHRANIMSENFKNIGIGYQVNANGTAYWVQLFTA